MRQPYPNELMHYGILGMKWGIRRFQNPDGTLTEAGKRRYGSIENFETRTILKKLRKTEKRNTKNELLKQKAIASGSASEISKYTSQMSDSELASALNRVKNKQALDDLVLKEGRKSVDQMIDRMSTIATAGEKFTNMYNAGAKIFNAFSKEKQLHIIGEKRTDLADKKLEKLMVEKDMEYFKKHQKEFSTDELRKVNERKAQVEKVEDWANKDAKQKARESKKAASEKSASNEEHTERKYTSEEGYVYKKGADGNYVRVANPKTKTSEPPVYSVPRQVTIGGVERKDYSPKVESFVKSEIYPTVINRLGDDVVRRGKSKVNRYFGVTSW